jgi:hypothetical protein
LRENRVSKHQQTMYDQHELVRSQMDTTTQTLIAGVNDLRGRADQTAADLMEGEAGESGNRIGSGDSEHSFRRAQATIGCAIDARARKKT